MRKVSALILCTALVLSAVSCSRIINKFTNDQNLKKVGELWSDVPRMDGLASSEADLPIFVHLLMRTALNNLYRFNKEGEDKTPGTGDWAVFSTPKSADEVRSFYTNDRMTSFGRWDPSKNSTCMNGSEYRFSGIACVFAKNENKLGIGLLIVAAQDEQKKQTNVFFVRVETPNVNPPPTKTNTPAPYKGEIKPLRGSAPYAIEKRPMPAGLNLAELLPQQVGPYIRTLLEKSNQRGVTPSSIEVDGNSVYATYKAGDKEVFMEFAVTANAGNAQAILDTAAGETTDTFPTDPRFGSLGTEPSYVKVNNEYGAFYAWTRGNYFFSANAKGGEKDLDLFLLAFPY